MFGIGMQELVLIGVIAVIVIGPKQLPEVARALGKGYAEFRRAFDEMKRSVDAELRTEDVKRALLDIPPPPAPGAPAPPPPASLLGTAPSPYPEVMDATPPPPEPAAAPPAPPAPPAPAGSEEARGRA